jgi:hypothetical protein
MLSNRVGSRSLNFKQIFIRIFEEEKNSKDPDPAGLFLRFPRIQNTFKIQIKHIVQSSATRREKNRGVGG